MVFPTWGDVVVVCLFGILGKGLKPRNLRFANLNDVLSFFRLTNFAGKRMVGRDFLSLEGGKSETKMADSLVAILQFSERRPRVEDLDWEEGPWNVFWRCRRFLTQKEFD